MNKRSLINLGGLSYTDGQDLDQEVLEVQI